MAPSIFYKICGNCMAHVPHNAAECACGHSFELDKPDLTRTAEVLRTETEERLYEAYLEARLQQALETLRAVREACGGGKWTREQAENVRHALKAVDLARRDLTAQRHKVVDASEVAEVARARRAQRQRMKPKDIPAMPAVESFSSTMPERQRAEQAHATERSTPATQQCPHCSATVSLNATRCACGYEFSAITMVPELVLPSEKYLPIDVSEPATS